jgi:hypothetical protein
MIDTLPSLSITMRMYGWSKWGGGSEGLVKEELEEWYCQSCGEKQLREFPSYMIPVDKAQRDYIRVCVWCKAQSVMNNLTFCQELLKLMKKI